MAESYSPVVKSPKTPTFLVAWIGVFKPNTWNQKRAYYQNYFIYSNQILHSNKDHPMPFVGSPNTHITNLRWLTLKICNLTKSKMAAAAVLKNRKIAISRPRFGRFRPNLARRRSSAFLSRLSVKNFKNLKIPLPYLGDSTHCNRPSRHFCKLARMAHLAGCQFSIQCCSTQYPRY